MLIFWSRYHVSGISKVPKVTIAFDKRKLNVYFNVHQQLVQDVMSMKVDETFKDRLTGLSDDVSKIKVDQTLVHNALEQSRQSAGDVHDILHRATESRYSYSSWAFLYNLMASSVSFFTDDILN